MPRYLTTKLTIAAALAVAGAPAHGQQTTLQPVQELPARMLDLQVQETDENNDSQQKPPVMTHIVPPEPDNPPKSEESETGTPGNESGGGGTAPADSGRHEDDPGAEADIKPRDSNNAGPSEGIEPDFGTETPNQGREPGARDYARFGRGNLLDRPPAGFAPLAERQPRAPRAAPAADAEYEPCELLVVSDTMDEAQAAREDLSALSIDIRRRYALSELDIVLSVFCAPEPGETEQTLAGVVEQFPSLTVALNHRYVPAAESRYYARAIGWRDELHTCGAGRRIGLVDTGIDAGHEAFADARLKARKLLSPGEREADREHGTATASVLAGTPGRSPGLVNTAALVAANVFRRRSNGSVDTTAELLARAIDWLLAEEVEVINMSLAGPANHVLERAVAAASSSGILMVAAAGNGDRNPVFPAAYPDVIAVTAVDARRRIYARANRGDYIDFAAPGVDLFLAAPGNRSKYYTGTSFATPFVTAALAVLKTIHPESDSAALLDHLASGAVDLGDTGRDPIFGWGLVQAPADCRTFASRD